MRMLTFITLRSTICLLVLMSAISLSAQGKLTLVGPSIRNGSFEEGSLSPWTFSAGTLTVAQDATFASDGEWFAVVSDTTLTTVLRPVFGQSIPASTENGLTFVATFDARNGQPGFASARVGFNAQNSDGSVAFSTSEFFSLTDSAWQTFQAEFQVPATWDGGGGIRLNLGFSGTAVPGTTYTGFIDNVILEQIPEPSTLALLLAGGALVLLRALAWGRRVRTP